MNPADHGRVRITPATWITICRLVGVFIFILLVMYHTLELKQGRGDSVYRVWALGLFLVVAATDFLDGWVARLRGEITPLGTFLDPVADKLLVVSSLIMFTKPSIPGMDPQFPIWFTWLVISRDVYLFAGAVLVHGTGVKLNIRPRWVGKLATLLNLTAITFVLAKNGGNLLTLTLYAAALATLGSWWQYTRDGLSQTHVRGNIGH